MSRQQRLTLIATILGSTVVFLDATVINVALPAIADDLDANLAGQQWVVEAYMLTLVAEPAADQQQRHHRQHVGHDDPLLAGSATSSGGGGSTCSG